MATIINQANLTYTYGTTTQSVLSNPAVTERNDPIAIEKRALDEAYRAGAELTYLISIRNSGAAAVQDLVVTDDLGAFTPAGSDTPLVPLTYSGPAALYLDGVFFETLTPAVTDSSVTFTLPAIPADTNALIVYQARVNGFAPLEPDSEITNTVAVGEQNASASVPVDSYADVSIEKDMSPNPIDAGAELTVTFTIENRGNLAATDLVLVDDFPVPLTDVSVSVNGVPVTDFTFENDRLTLPAAGSTQTTLTVPAATFSANADGSVLITPGTLTVVLTGNI